MKNFSILSQNRFNSIKGTIKTATDRPVILTDACFNSIKGTIKTF